MNKLYPAATVLTATVLTATALKLVRRATAIANAADRVGQPRLADDADLAARRMAQVGAPAAQAMPQSQMSQQQIATVIGEMQSYLAQLQKQVQTLAPAQIPQATSIPQGFDPLAVHTGYLDTTGMPMGQQNVVKVPDNNYDTKVSVDTGLSGATGI